MASKNVIPKRIYLWKDYHFFGKVPTAGSAWITWNLFDFPAGILPVTKVTKEDETNLNSKFQTNDLVRMWSLWNYGKNKSLYEIFMVFSLILRMLNPLVSGLQPYQKRIQGFCWNATCSPNSRTTIQWRTCIALNERIGNSYWI